MSNDERAQAEEVFRWGLVNAPRTPAPEFEPGAEGYGPELCANEDCEAPLPDLRRRRGCTLCTDCKTAAEAAAKRRY